MSATLPDHIEIRWLIRRDMEHVLEIESQLCNSWPESAWMEHLRKRNCIGMVYDNHPQGRPWRIDGVMLYELGKGELTLLRLAVRKEARRQGVASQMIRRLQGKLSQQRRSTITVDVPDSLTDMHLCLRECGFFALPINSETYRFTYHHEESRHGVD